MDMLGSLGTDTQRPGAHSLLPCVHVAPFASVAAHTPLPDVKLQ
jgi:hypothetical protein